MRARSLLSPETQADAPSCSVALATSLHGVLLPLQPQSTPAHAAATIQGFGEDDYIVVDCPGQIELFTHIPVLRTFVDFLKNDGWNVCAVFCLDCHFISDSAKFIAGCFQALSAMVTLELPHVNVLTKVDLLDDKVPHHSGSVATLRTCAVVRTCALSFAALKRCLVEPHSWAYSSGVLSFLRQWRQRWSNALRISWRRQCALTVPRCWRR